MSRVLVTGGAGYIGVCVVEELVKRGHTPVVLDAFLFGRESLSGFGDRVSLIEGDVRSSRDVIRALEGVDKVIHLAGIVGAPACAIDPLATFTTNVESTNTLVNCMTDPEVRLVPDLVFCSSCSIYGNAAGIHEEVTEETPTMPLSSYAASKVRGEDIIRRKAAEVPHFSPTILRLTTVFGWSRRPRFDLVTNAFVSKGMFERKITIFGTGEQYRSLIHVRDVATALVAACEAPRFLRDRKIFHVGDERNNVTVRALAEIVQRHLPETEIVFAPQHDTDRRDYRISCQRIKNALNWSAGWSVEAGIAELIENLRIGGVDPGAASHYNDRRSYN